MYMLSHGNVIYRVNSAALSRVPAIPIITSIEGIIRDGHGNPTGIFLDASRSLIEEYIPTPSLSTKRKALQLVLHEINSHGITSVHNMGSDNTDIELYKAAIDEGWLSLRISHYRLAQNISGLGYASSLDDAPIIYNYKDRLSVRGLKFFLDGALGIVTLIYRYYIICMENATLSINVKHIYNMMMFIMCVYIYSFSFLVTTHVSALNTYKYSLPYKPHVVYIGSNGASLLAPYSDNNNITGSLLIDQHTYRSLAYKWMKKGYQIASHAIGDKANRLALDTYEHIQKLIAQNNKGESTKFRNRIEHAQVLDPIDLPRFAALNIIPSMQVS